MVSVDGALVMVLIPKLTVSPVSIELANSENRALTFDWSVVEQLTTSRLEPALQLSVADTPISEGNLSSR